MAENEFLDFGVELRILGIYFLTKFRLNSCENHLVRGNVDDFGDL